MQINMHFAKNNFCEAVMSRYDLFRDLTNLRFLRKIIFTNPEFFRNFNIFQASLLR